MPEASGGRRRLLVGLAICAVLAAVGIGVALLVAAGGSSGPALRKARLGRLTIEYPARLHRERPLPGEAMAFLAERRAPPGQVGETFAVRAAPKATAGLAQDIRALDDVERFSRPGLRRVAKQPAGVSGAAGAYLLIADYPDHELGGRLVRQVDLVIRQRSGASTHIVWVGPPRTLPRSDIDHVIRRVRLG